MTYHGGVWFPSPKSGTSAPHALQVDVVIPALNEQESIALVLSALADTCVRRVIVVDNGSDDDTAMIAQELGAVVVSEPRRGYGSACLAGMDRVRQDPPDVLIFLDADYSDHPEEIPRLLEPIHTDGVDMVIGSRTIGQREPGALLPQALFGNALATFLIAQIYGYRFTDLGPFRAIRWEALEALEMRDTNYGWTVEMQIKAAFHEISCVEVPVSYRKRVGESKISGTIKGSINAGYKILLTIFTYALDLSKESPT